MRRFRFSGVLDQQLCDLHAVGGCALAHLIAAAPETQTVGIGQVGTDAADEHEILIRRVERHGILQRVEIVHKAAAGGGGDGRARLVHGDVVREVHGGGDGVAAHDGHAHTGARHVHVRQMQDLAALVLELHLLGGVAVALLAADLRDDVVGDLVREHLRGIFLAVAQGVDLVLQLDRAAGARAGHGLICRDDHAADGRELAQRVDGRERDGGRAVGVCDDAVVQLHVAGVDLRYDERHVRVETEGRGVIHEHGAGAHDRGGKTLGDVVFRRTEDDVHAGEGGVRRLLDDDVLPLPRHDLAGRAGACEQVQLPDGEAALGEDLHHFLTHGAACAEDGNTILLHI